MKHTIVTKFIAILLAACMLVLAAGCAAGIAILGQSGLYMVGNFDAWKTAETEDRAQNIAEAVANRYAAEKYGNLPDSLRGSFIAEPSDTELCQWYELADDSWSCTLASETGVLLYTDGRAVAGTPFTFSVSPRYLVLTTAENYEILTADGQGGDYYLRTLYGSPLEVTVTVADNAFSSYGGVSLTYVQQFFGLRYGLIAMLAVSLLLFAVGTVYLCCAAGKSSHGSPAVPGGLNRLPLDLYAAAGGGSCTLLVMLAIFILSNWFLTDDFYNVGALALAALVLNLAAIIGLGFLFALAAQVKARNLYWWHHSIIGWCCGKLWQGIRVVCRGLARLFSMLPLIWKWLVLGAVMGFVPVFSLFLAAVGRDYWLIPLFLSLVADLAIICYGAYAYGSLLAGVKRLSAGNLTTKISTRYLRGSFRQCAEHLNALAEVATLAAKKQMQSERMKAELITNVSHDIKTPLTSIINYVDLLQKPHSPEEGSQYLEVLGRQSQRMKKLIDDLMEMSKASTGNMAVEITQVDAAEAVNQALGEFSDKLTAARLTPVFRQPEAQVAMLADGRLTWRVLSNLLSNTVKYALPGTRVYVDLASLEGRVCISLKNISKEPLNISAEELTERFVRGDASRNTEGSGLGLNIAKSLMELQHGQLELLVDGDLFKVTLIFPAL